MLCKTVSNMYSNISHQSMVGAASSDANSIKNSVKQQKILIQHSTTYFFLSFHGARAYRNTKENGDD